MQSGAARGGATAGDAVASLSASALAVRDALAGLIHDIKRAPHRDVSHVPFPLLVSRYVGGLHSIAKSVPQSENVDSSTADRLRCYNRDFSEWCLRSVFAKKWTDVQLDVRTHASEHEVTRPSSATTGVLCSRWPPAGPCGETSNGEPEVAGTIAGNLDDVELSLLTTSAFVSTSGYASTGDSIASERLIADRVPTVGVPLLEGICRRLRAPPARVDSSSSGTDAKRKKVDILLVPFSVLYDLRRLAYHRGADSQRAIPVARSHVDAGLQSYRMAQSALHMIHLTLSAQSAKAQACAAANKAVAPTHTSATTSGPPLLAVIPPTIEFQSIIALSRCAAHVQQQQRSLDAASNSAAGVAVPPSISVLCENPMLRFGLLSGPRRDVTARLLLPSSVSANLCLNVVVQDAHERRSVTACGGRLASSQEVVALVNRVCGTTEVQRNRDIHRDVREGVRTLAKQLRDREA